MSVTAPAYETRWLPSVHIIGTGATKLVRKVAALTAANKLAM